ncbi:hypothetical protein BDZ91DRAFT_711736 [Kalaharituber pfeilii]|nr:hypothetical protein BDZ91DRAFT_711736 [Kalaharituber pfeilii]
MSLRREQTSHLRVLLNDLIWSWLITKFGGTSEFPLLAFYFLATFYGDGVILHMFSEVKPRFSV